MVVGISYTHIVNEFEDGHVSQVFQADPTVIFFTTTVKAVYTRRVNHSKALGGYPV